VKNGRGQQVFKALEALYRAAAAAGNGPARISEMARNGGDYSGPNSVPEPSLDFGAIILIVIRYK
jgi:hypothetical protein